MMTRTEALQFARQSARMAFDQAGEYADSIASFRENLADTFKDERVTKDDQVDAFMAWGDEVRLLNAQGGISASKLAVRKLIDTAERYGYKPTKVNDGDIVRVSNAREVMDAVFAVDECTVYFKHPDEAKAHCAVIVLGNDGWDAIADCSMGDRWDAVIADVEAWMANVWRAE